MDYITRNEFERLVKEQERLKEEQKEIKKRLEQRTEEIKAVRVDFASEDVVKRLDNLRQELNVHSETWLNTLQEHYTEHKEAISDVKTIQSGHAKFFEEHGKRLAVTVTKDDISKLETHFDKIEGCIDEQGRKVDQMFQILQKLQEKLGG